MTTKDKTTQSQVSYYGKKLYYVNALLIAKNATVVKKEPQYHYEDIEHDKDR